MLNFLRTYLARKDDPYAGGDIDNAQRIGAVLFGLQVLLILVLLPLSPPTRAIGNAGWFVAGAMVLGGLAVTYAAQHRRFQSWAVLLAASYAAVAALALMQWLGGGIETPYERVILLPVFFVAAIQPPRRIAGFLGFVLLIQVLPFLYDGWTAQALGASFAAYVIWAGLSFGVSLPMGAIRAQRLAHARDEAKARKEARVDSLTGLNNRRAFDEALTKETGRARRLRIPLSMAMVDVVNFKEINDYWSPSEGDRCLREIAETLRSTLRDPDDCFRWGGDEFALILAGTTAADSGALADRLHDAISSRCKRPDNEPIEIRFAVAELRDETPEELVEMAGLSLTAAKLETSR